MKSDNYIRHAKLLRIVDPDTFEIALDLGFYLTQKSYIRLARLDAPETRGSEAPAGKYVEKLLSQQIEFHGIKDGIGVDCVIESTLKPSIYNRIVAELWIGDFNVNDWLLESNLAWERKDAKKLVRRDIGILSIPKGLMQLVRENQL